jgi:hypothetical protein
LATGAQELAAHLIVGDLGDENGDAGREEDFKPLYDLGVDPLSVRWETNPRGPESSSTTSGGVT